MNRHLFLAISLTSLLAFSSSQALTLEFSTCNFFNYGCGKTIQNSVQENSGGFSFANFFNKLELPALKVPSWFGDSQNTEKLAQVAQLGGGTFSPSVINTDKTSDPNAPGSADFGIGKSNSDGSTPQGLLSKKQIFDKQANFKDILQKCADGSTACISQANQSKTDTATTTTYSPGLVTGDNLTGVQSPNYDSHESMQESYGPVTPGINNTQLSSVANSYDGAKVNFANPGSGNCSGYGIDVGGSCASKAFQQQFLSTVSNLCSNLTGKRLKITSGYRDPACNARVGGASQSSHMSGLAMDTSLEGYSQDEKVIVALYFMAQGFNNFGGYGPNGAMHLDMRNSVNRWGRCYSISCCNDAYFPEYFRIAMSKVGSTPCARDSGLRQKAINALKQMGKEKFTIPANNKQQ